MNYLQIGVAEGLIKLNDDDTRITCINRNKTYNFKDKKGQISFPKLRLYLNKVFYAYFDGVAQPNFMF